MPGKPRLCAVCNKTRVSCGFVGSNPTHCGKCKLEGMTNLTVTKCKVCNIIASYGLPGEIPTYCKDHKSDKMINIRAYKCKNCNKTQAVYGIEGTKTAEYCVKCKKNGMVDVRSILCIGCNIKQPSFGNLSDKKAIYCKECKLPEMVDLRSIKCVVCNIKYPVYGIPGQKNTHCKDCKGGEHVDVKNSKCIMCNKKQSTYGDPDTKVITHCKDCKLDQYIDLKHKSCASKHCTTRAQDKFKGYCAWCFQHLFPEDPISRAIHTKTFETAVATELLAYDPNYKHDRPIYIGNCECPVRRRIDFWKVINNTILAIEVDEDQHRSYNKVDERIRYDDLYMGFSGKWVFIRFNPNIFRDSNGKIIKIPLKDRIQTLVNTIKEEEQRIQKEDNKELLDIRYLFYNEQRNPLA